MILHLGGGSVSDGALQGCAIGVNTVNPRFSGDQEQGAWIKIPSLRNPVK